MSDDRPTTWTADESEGSSYWDRWILGPAPLRLTVTDWHGIGDAPGWRWSVLLCPGQRPEDVAYQVRSHHETDPLPTREFAQAAAEQWVRDFAGELLRAVGPGELLEKPEQLEPTP